MYRARTAKLNFAAAMLFFLGGVIMLLLVHSVNRRVDTIADVSSQNQQGVQCVLRELGHHRRNSYRTDLTMLEVLGVGPDQIGEAPPEYPEGWAVACERFFEKPVNGR